MSTTIQGSKMRRSLLTEMTTFGVDDWLFVINVQVLMILGAGLRIYSWAIVAVVLHLILMLVTQLQPRVLSVYMGYIRQRERYTTWINCELKRGKRPAWLLTTTRTEF